MKRSIFAFGLLGLVGCFLPLIAGVSWFDMRHFDDSWTVWFVLAAFALPTYAGIARGEGDRAAAIVGLASFGYTFFEFRTGTLDLITHGSIGGIMMGVAVIGGFVCSLLVLGATRTR
jgi:hypothetical protein